MTDRPIIFSAPMVQALLAGRKTQTRRIIKPQPHIDGMGNFCVGSWNYGQHFDGRPCVRNFIKEKVCFAVGDRLWVREAHYLTDDGSPIYRASTDDGIAALADHARTLAGVKWTSPIHMPRRLSRLTLTVTDVRVQRVQEISTADVLAEGAPIDPDYRDTSADGSGPPMIQIGIAQWQSPRAWYHTLYDTLHGPGAWEANPWIVALTFTVEQKNIDA